jgi:hypothetical protein
MTARRRATVLTIAKGPRAILPCDPEGIGLMQTIVLSCLFGAVCTMVLWVVGSAAAKRDLMIRRGGKLFPPEEF